MRKAPYINGVPQVRPWVRFFARRIDMIIIGYFLGIIFSPIYAINEYVNSLINQTNVYILGTITLFVFTLTLVFVEALLLSSWGTTPGKWLLGIKIRDYKNRKLTYQSALKRSFLVWVFGLGAGFILIMQIENLISYFYLNKTRITIWDKKIKCKVFHKKINNENIIVAIVVIIIDFIMSIFYF